MIPPFCGICLIPDSVVVPVNVCRVAVLRGADRVMAKGGEEDGRIGREGHYRVPRTFCVVAGEWDGASSAVRRLVSARVRERQRPSQQLSGQSTWRGSLSAPLLSLRRVLSPHGERQSQNHLAEDREGESHDGQRRGHSSLLIRTHLQTAAEGWRMKRLVPRLHPPPLSLSVSFLLSPSPSWLWRPFERTKASSFAFIPRG